MATRVERLAFVLTVSERRLVDGLRRAAKGVNDLERSTTQSSRVIRQNFKALDQTIDRFASKATGAVLNLRTAIAGLAAGAGAAAPVKLASTFEKALADVDTLLVGAEVGIKRYREQLVELSKTTSKELVDLTRGLYQTISAGIPVVEGAGGAFDVLNVAQKAAVAGLSTTEQSVDAFATILNAYRDSALDAADVSDKLFTAVRLGRTTFPELAGSIGRVATVAAQFSISIDEVLSALVALTRVGLSTDEAVTALRAIILGVASPSDRARSIFEKLGIEIGETAFKSKGLSGVLANISKATGDSADAIVELIPNVRALVGGLGLGRRGARDFIEVLHEIENSAGATDSAFNKLKRTFAEQATVLKNRLLAALITAGESVLPQVLQGLQDLVDYLTTNGDRIASGFTSFVNEVINFVRFVATNGKAAAEVIATFFSVKIIGAATVALGAFATRIKEVFVAASAAEAAGAAAGTGFLGGFKNGLKGLGQILSAALRSPGVVALFAAAALYLGKILGDYLAQEVEAAAERAAEELQEIRERGQEQADRLGAVSPEQAQEFERDRRSGLRVRVQTAEGERLVLVKELVDTFKELNKTQEQAEKLALSAALAESANLKKQAERERAKVDALVAQQLAAAAAVKRLREEAQEARDSGADLFTLAGLVKQLNVEEDRLNVLTLQVGAASEYLSILTKAGKAVVDNTQAAIAEANARREAAEAERKRQEQEAKEREAAARRARAAAAAARRRRSAAAARERAERERLKLIAEAGKAEREALDAALETERTRFEARKAETDEILSRETAALEERQRLELEAINESARVRGSVLEELGQALLEPGLREKKLNEDIAAEKFAQENEAREQVIATAQVRQDTLAAQEALIRRQAKVQIQLLNEEADAAAKKAREDSDRVAKKFGEDSFKRFELEAATTRRIEAIRKASAEEIAAIELEVAAEAAELRIQIEEQVQEARKAQRELRDSFATGSDGAPEVIAGVADSVQRASDAFDNFIKNPDFAIGDFDLAALRFRLEEDDGGFERLGKLIYNGFADAVQAGAEALLGVLNDSFVTPIKSALFEPLDRLLGTLSDAVKTISGSSFTGTGGAFKALVGFNKSLDDIDALLDRLAAGLPLIIEDVMSRISEELPRIIVKVAGLAGDALVAVAKNAGPLFQAIIKGLVDALPDLFDSLAEAIPLIVDALIGAFTSSIAALPSLFGSFFDALVDALDGLAAVLAEKLGPLVEELVRGVLQSVSIILERVPDVIEAILGAVLAAVQSLIDSLPDIVTALIEELPRLVQALILFIPRIGLAFVAAVLQALPALIDSLPGVIQGLIANALPALINGVVDALVRSISQVFAGDLFEAIIMALPAIGESLLVLIPNLVVAIVEGFGELFVNLWEDLKGFFSGEFIVAIGEAFLAAIKSLVEGAGDFASDFTGISLGRKIFTGNFGDIGLSDVPVIGGTLKKIGDFFGFHQGGVAPGESNPLAARAMRLMGAPAFAQGGMVGVLNENIRARLGSAVPDDVPAILQAGEGVLTRAAVQALGGPAAIDALNSGRGGGQVQVLQPVIEGPSDEAFQALVDIVLSQWRMEARTPGSGVEQTLNRGAFTGIRMARGRT